MLRYLTTLFLMAVSAGDGRAAVVSGKDLVLGTPQHVDSSVQKGVTVLVFLSARCPCSAGHESVLASIAQKFSEVKFVGLHANADESPELAREHFSQSALPFPVIRDENQRWAKHFGAYKTPHVFILDNQGEVLYSGGVDASRGTGGEGKFLLDALSQIEAAVRQGKKPKLAVPKTRVLGCVISRG